jgi:hypothetical protein
MKTGFILLILVFCTQALNAQLDPAYFGSYISEDGTDGFLVYTMDEVAEDCFLVEYEVYDQLEILSSETGYGHCDGENGHMEIIIETNAKKIEVSFSKDEENNNLLTVYSADGSSKAYYGFSEEEMEYTEEAMAEFYFTREDGAELIIYGVGDEVGFSLFGLMNDACGQNELNGMLISASDDLTVFKYSGTDGCSIEFQLSENSVNVIEENCALAHPKCPKWSGMYYLGE